MNLTTAPVASLPSGAKDPAAEVRVLPGIGLVGFLALLALEVGRAPWGSGALAGELGLSTKT